jgi:hypothetical protein
MDDRPLVLLHYHNCYRNTLNGPYMPAFYGRHRTEQNTVWLLCLLPSVLAQLAQWSWQPVRNKSANVIVIGPYFVDHQPVIVRQFSEFRRVAITNVTGLCACLRMVRNMVVATKLCWCRCGCWSTRGVLGAARLCVGWMSARQPALQLLRMIDVVHLRLHLHNVRVSVTASQPYRQVTCQVKR